MNRGQASWDPSPWQQVPANEPSQHQPQRRRRRPLRDLRSRLNLRLLGLVAMAFLAVVMLALAWSRMGNGRAWTADAPEGITDVPPPSDEEASAPLGVPELYSSGHTPTTVPGTAAGTAASGAFLVTQDDGTPVGWDPCRPVHYVVNDKVAPHGADKLVRDGVDRISRATGLQFVYDGTIKEVPGRARAAYQPGHYGERWAPILIAWRNGSDTSTLGHGVLGHAWPSVYPESGPHKRIVSGSLTLDSGDARKALDTGDTRQVVAVIEHELGHLVGLGHTSGLMAERLDPRAGDPSELTPANLADLAVAGTRPCYPGKP